MFTFVFVFALVKELTANNHFCKGFHGVIKDSVVSLRPPNQLPQCHWDHQLLFFSVIEAAEAKLVYTKLCVENYLSEEKLCCWSFFKDSVSHWNRWSRFRGLYGTTASASAVSFKLPNPLPRSHWNRGSRPFRTNIPNFSANLKQYAKRFLAH
jgi:hypothetical protein